MENNEDLLARIRRSQQSGPLNDQYDDNGSNQVVSENIQSEEEAENAPDGYFQKSSFPLPSFWVLIFSLITTALILGVSGNIMEFHFYE